MLSVERGKTFSSILIPSRWNREHTEGNLMAEKEQKTVKKDGATVEVGEEGATIEFLGRTRDGKARLKITAPDGVPVVKKEDAEPPESTNAD